MTEGNSLEWYQTKYCRNFIKEYSSEKGYLTTEDGTELPCKFKVGQLVNGKITFTCECSIFDLDIRRYFPDINFEKSSPYEIKVCIAWSIYSPINVFQLLKKVKSFYGVTSDGYNITGKISHYVNTDNDSLRDYTPQIKIKYSVQELIIYSDVEKNLQSLIFKLTNFKFIGPPLILDIDGKRLEIREIDESKDALNFLETCKGICVTCEVIVEINKEADIENSKTIVSDLCDIISIATGTRVQWIYYYVYNSEGKIVLWTHEPRVTKPYFSKKIIDYDDFIIMKKFIESSYATLAKKTNILRTDEKTAKPLINAYLDAKAENDYLEGRGIKLVVLMEMLKDSLIKSKSLTQNIIKDEYFNSVKSVFKDKLTQAIEKSIDEENKEKSEQDREAIKKEIKEKMFAKISEINKISFRDILQNLCDDINLEVKQDYLQSVVDSRNKLIHEGKFLCKSDKIKNRYKDIEKYPQFQDSIHEYFFLVNFMDKCFLKLLGYKGFYFNWRDINEIKEEELT